ncbi:hypothetical protein [Mogibacterium diversum]|jgi:hypothetical protein|nr:hypothetical protein [Mogibacterium diversum]
MVYDNTMVLPSHAICMECEEMRYVEGGYTVNLSRTFVERSVDIAIMVAGWSGAGVATVGKLARKIGKKQFETRMVKAAAKFGIKKVYAQRAAQALSVATGLSIGSGVAYLLDRYDKTGLNGRVQF